MAFVEPPQLDSLQDLLLRHLEMLYDTEHQVIELLPQLSDATQSKDLQDFFRWYFRSSQSQLVRLESLFQHLAQNPNRSICHATKGLAQDCNHVRTAAGKPGVRDIALINAARQLQQHKLAGYSSALDLAKQMEEVFARNILKDSLNLQSKANVALSEVASQVFNTEG